MSKSFTEMPGESSDRGTAQIAKHVRQAENAAEQRTGYHQMRRRGFIAGGVFAAVAVVGILVVTVLPTLTPKAPASVQPAVTSGFGSDHFRQTERDAQVTQAPKSAVLPSLPAGGLSNAMGDAYQVPPSVVLPASLEGPSAIAAANPGSRPASLEGPSTTQASTATTSAGAAAPARVDAYWESVTQSASPSQTQPSALTAPGFTEVTREPTLPPDWLMGTASQNAPSTITPAVSDATQGWTRTGLTPWLIGTANQTAPHGISAAGSVTSTH